MVAIQAKTEMLIRSTAEAAFDAFVDPVKLTSFWLARSSGPLAPDATVRWEFMVEGASEQVKVTAFTPSTHLAFKWSDGGIQVDVRFANWSTGGVVVTVIASGFPDANAAVGATEGFSIVLCDLKTLLETGRSANLVRDKAALISGTT